MTVIELRDKLIDAGIASVREHETRSERIRGGIAGFELCRNLSTPDEFLRTLRERTDHEHEMKSAHVSGDDPDANAYWEYRYATVQVEFVWERMKVAWRIGPTQSARAILHVHELTSSAS